MDAFAGVGAASIRMTNNIHCLKVIANDWNPRRLQCLSNNAKVYECDSCIEITENDFMQIERRGIDLVFVQPPLGEFEGSTCLSIVDFEPTLDKIIFKCLRLANNFMLLLPPATSVDVLCSCINKCAS